MSFYRLRRRVFLLRSRVAFFSLLCGLAVALPLRAGAGACGGDVGGERVACACGDLVVSDTVLWPTDPVVSEPCTGDGLIIQAPPASNGITLNLGGQTIVGSGRGIGIRVARGGQVGSTILGGDEEDSRAEIARFRTGIRASGRNALVELVGVDLSANTGDGLKLRTSGTHVEDIRSTGNGRHGAAVTGHGNEVVAVVAQKNHGDGLQVRGSGTEIDAETSGNDGDGTVIGGRGNHAASIQSTGNAGVGVKASGRGHRIAEMKTDRNGAGAVKDRSGATR